MKKTGIFGLISGELIAFIGGGYWVGSSLDKHWQTSPALTLVFVFVGLAYGGWRISRLAKEWMKDSKPEG
jgi:F0F1-type ATP synthase assembly protein I